MLGSRRLSTGGRPRRVWAGATAIATAAMLWAASVGSADVVPAVVGQQAAGGAVPVLGVSFIDSEGYGHAHPRTLSSGPQAVTFRVTNIRWRNWGARQAVGFGTGAYVPKGQPFSAARPRRKELVAYDLGVCRGQLAYRKLDWWYPGLTKRAHYLQRADGSAASLCTLG
jgi:hypothetical protein